VLVNYSLALFMKIIFSSVSGFWVDRWENSYIIRDNRNDAVCNLSETAAVVFLLCKNGITLKYLKEELLIRYPDASIDDINQTVPPAIRQLEVMGLVSRAEQLNLPKTYSSTENLIIKRNEECRQSFVFFRGDNHGLFMEPLSFFVATGLYNRNLILLKDPHNARFNFGLEEIPNDFDSFIDRLYNELRALRHANEIYFVGTSSGAYAAIRAGYTLGVKGVYAFGLSSVSLNADDVAQGISGDKGQNPSSDLRCLLLNSNQSTKYFLCYNQGARHDSITAEELRGLDGVTLCSLPGDSHNVIKTLGDEQLLPKIFPKYLSINEQSSSYRYKK